MLYTEIYLIIKIHATLVYYVIYQRLLDPNSSQDLNNICLYLKESYSQRFNL